MNTAFLREKWRNKDYVGLPQWFIDEMADEERLEKVRVAKEQVDKDNEWFIKEGWTEDFEPILAKKVRNKIYIKDIEVSANDFIHLNRVLKRTIDNIENGVAENSLYQLKTMQENLEKNLEGVGEDEL